MIFSKNTRVNLGDIHKNGKNSTKSVRNCHKGRMCRGYNEIVDKK